MPRKGPILACPPVPTIADCGASHHDIPPSPPVTQLKKSPWAEESEECTEEGGSSQLDLEAEEAEEVEPEIDCFEEDDEDDFQLLNRQESMLIEDDEDETDLSSTGSYGYLSDRIAKFETFLNSYLRNWKYTAPELPKQRAPDTPRNATQFPFNFDESEATYHHALRQNWEDHCLQMKQMTETIPLENGLVSVKLLVSEARRLSLQHAHHKIDARRGKACSCHCTECPIPDDITDEEYLNTLREVWVQIRENVINEVLTDGQHFNTIRRLSTQYLFHEGKQLVTADMETPWLRSRLEYKKQILEELSMSYLLLKN
eukprot:TRINITY_DN11038_c0_g1_i2.p1 TRINITY_DN11038_c0_g1~~TRINITY_DN11038_c0_g1_i2.p1  ORF type:complete len:315 (+),score=63.34 TRINITY_DN11038_c0_g1_i2:40-984(+)